MIERIYLSLSKHIDGFLMSTIILALVVGMAVLYSAGGHSVGRMQAQAINIVIALSVLWVTANVPPQHLQRLALPIYVLGLLLLVGVALFGEISNGARRWLHLGVVRIQPSEIMKIGVPMLLAWYFARHEASPRLQHHLMGALLLAVPVVLVMKQPDLGTSLLIAASGFYVLFLAGLSWRFILGVGASIAVAAPILWTMLHDYQRRRIEILFDPYQDPLGAGYHTIQATIALGSGGLAGKGWLNGTQAQLDFIPERTTDFIFAVFGEEFGMLGNILLLLLYLLIIGRGLFIAAYAQSTFGRLLAGSITMTFFTYAFVNIGMVSGILPVVGVPLPLISYGGTSLVTLMLGLGILMSIKTHKKLVSS
ncbi:rod shape-determining protein RodA [Pseudomethylobacillus aquaticus]|uniref:Peptidoglycan glycosyltransferase MrdB n=1 Tax=Pseudomethylobacillus aquaticus TaxID=2676064 RepID=A0A3N0UUB7_9PROT|nr:rod shape-determining protein RodA [Pseudomethylobacillus aquaticus]ROH84065.1 rod shape-determining protein RodA [Pseudomethylobacillus aquaticus]